ncbi:MAG: tetratricopeptide repeat protein [Candidatus Latescibacterota bacterium]
MSNADPVALYRLGMSRFARQDFGGAAQALRQAVELDPTFADAHQALAHCHEKLGDLDAALASAQMAVEHNPEDPLAHTSLLLFYQRKGMIAQAEREKALAARLQSPDNP